MKEFVVTVLGTLVLVCFVAQWIASRTKSHMVASLNPEFKKFQRIFFAPYLLALFSDWLQGPYVYRLYSQYGYAPKEIALLYIVGFAASSTVGTFTGPLADMFGRRRLCLAFCFIYTFCCLTKMSPNFWWLFTGRLFGGVATSILFSTFEAWYVCEHTERNVFPADWISSTFSISTFWNGILAILSGVVADFGADWLNFGPVAPFMTAIPFLIASAILISLTWPENHGSRQFGLGRSFVEGLRTIFNDSAIFLLGLVQSMFESIMYIFVFLWTPILDSAQSTDAWPLGLVFSCFMVCIMIGSSMNTLLLNRNIRPSTILLMSVACSAISMITCAWSTNMQHRLPVISFLAFLLLEISVGMYFPAIGYLRSQVIPESQRASINNVFRVPLNVITCTVLYCLHKNDDSGGNHASGGDQNAFLFNVVLSLVGFVAAMAFSKKYEEKSKTSTDEKNEPLI